MIWIKMKQRHKKIFLNIFNVVGNKCILDFLSLSFSVFIHSSGETFREKPALVKNIRDINFQCFIYMTKSHKIVTKRSRKLEITSPYYYVNSNLRTQQIITYPTNNLRTRFLVRCPSSPQKLSQFINRVSHNEIKLN